MRRKKLALLLVATIGVLTVFSGCSSSGAPTDNTTGESADGTVTDSVDDEEVTEEAESSVIGAADVNEYPISDDMKAKLEGVNTEYSKVNWDVEYQPADGIIVSESIYTCIGDHGVEPYYMVIAYTNLNDAPVKITCQGDIMNTNGSVNHAHVDETDLVVWPGNTVLEKYICNMDEPSGDITWNTFNVETSDERYIPFEISVELSQDDDGYVVTPTFSADEKTKYYDCGMALLLDENGKILEAEAPPLSNRITYFNYNESHDGKVADAVFFINPEL